jgi:hypothetical protein
MKQLLVSGCSFTEYQNWPSLLHDWKNCNIVNYGVCGAGNVYIANSITQEILNNRPDFVFILWSGINRVDFRIPATHPFNLATADSRSLLESAFVISGGTSLVDHHWLTAYNAIKDVSWPEISTIEQWFELDELIKKECILDKIDLSISSGNLDFHKAILNYFVSQWISNNKKYYSEVSMQHIMMCTNLLEKKKIPYRFSFIYDITKEFNSQFLGQVSKCDYYYEIDWSKYIPLTPFEYGLKYDLLQDDNFHVTEDGMNQWALEIKKILQQQPDLQFLYNS